MSTQVKDHVYVVSDKQMRTIAIFKSKQLADDFIGDRFIALGVRCWAVWGERDKDDVPFTGGKVVFDQSILL